MYFYGKNQVRYRKYQIIFLIICIFVLPSILLYTKWKDASKVITLLPTADPNDPLAYTCCTPSNNSTRKNVFFLKTHKTGSTTVQSILLRYAILNSLDAMCIRFDSYYWPLSENSLEHKTKTQNKKYHILAHHMRYDSKLKSYQYNDTPMVTIIRNPATLFQSSYEFYKMYLKTGMSFQQFLRAKVKPRITDMTNTFIHYIGYNQISSDLGFNLIQNKNATAINEFIAKIDREFDLVMILEHMDESLVLLANLMGWPLENMVHVDFNVRPRQSNSYNMTEEDVSVLMDLNPVDTLLYQHFLNKFHRCMRQYGEKRLNDQINRLKIINKQFKEKCAVQEVVGYHDGSAKIMQYVSKNQSDLECVYSTQVNPNLRTVACNLQAERLSRL